MSSFLRIAIRSYIAHAVKDFKKICNKDFNNFIIRCNCHFQKKQNKVIYYIYY